MTISVMTDQKKFKNLLEKSGIPCIEMKVYGVLKLNIIIETKGRETAEKWVNLLSSLTEKPTIKVIESLKDYLQGTKQDSCLLKHSYKIWRVYCVI